MTNHLDNAKAYAWLYKVTHCRRYLVIAKQSVQDYKIMQLLKTLV